MAVSTIKNVVSPTAECPICCNEVFCHDFVFIHADQACHGCVKQIFTNAILSEASYPPVWAGHTLPLTEYQHILGSALSTEFARKAAQYDVPWDERVICKNQSGHTTGGEVFVGRLHTQKTNTTTIKSCDECTHIFCLLCAEHIQSSTNEHHCKEAETDPNFTGLTRGKDYQLCPGCSTAVELRDGCNHVVCTCSQDFCFICGQEAQGDSNHWVPGRCPRYKHVDSGAASWDAVYTGVDEEVTAFPFAEQLERLLAAQESVLWQDAFIEDRAQQPGTLREIFRPDPVAHVVARHRQRREARREARRAAAAINPTSAERYFGGNRTARRRADTPHPQSHQDEQARRVAGEALLLLASARPRATRARSNNTRSVAANPRQHQHVHSSRHVAFDPMQHTFDHSIDLTVEEDTEIEIIDLTNDD
ncbi:hypothetical protein CERZMDRAFT_101028 [Cercospora zeae-maydis SCOH1-5]|uniref:IBR domain-containing protein n=1 Tax=Cercospora zeae-maydis SCOH1-5 TaxID=717836 RepID=A0A6A6F2Y1_9PEZI|nr:hypothetical protein CERZMDRAFT_101028 [Cercospora zeae-maydis SCOH1-5]